MMLESDVLYAVVKPSDWLKGPAERILKKVVAGDLGKVHASRESLHELYYVSMEEGVSVEGYLSRLASLTSIPNLEFLATDRDADMLAVSLIKQFGLTSIFDAYYAATCLSKVEDRTMVSADGVYDRIPGIRRIDPREFKP